MSDVLRKQLDAIDVQCDLLKVMVAGARQTLNAPRAEMPDRLPTCHGSEDDDCARRNADACTTFRTGQRMCRGCGLDPVTGQAAPK